MKFEKVAKDLRITAETVEEAKEIVQHYKLDAFEHVDAVLSGKLTYLDLTGGEDSEWFEQREYVSRSFLQPYLDELQQLSGVPLEDVPRLSIPNYPQRRNPQHKLCHTHTVTAAWLDADGFVFEGWQCARAWGGRSAAAHAQKLFDEYVRSSVGRIPSEPEYLRVDRLFRKNPNYFARHAARPAAESRSIMDVLYRWWLETQANPKQREVLLQALETHRSVCKFDSLADMLGRAHGVLHPAWGSAVSFQEFQQLQ